jgi:hypothetical protein
MAQFKSGWDFIHFSETVRSRYRYAHTPETREFLQVLVETSNSRVIVIPATSTYWRAQLGCSTAERSHEEADQTIIVEEWVPFPIERMKPRRNAAHEGRVNPKGIPCLYLATTKETAMSEVRPWLGAKVSVAAFRIERNLNVVNASVDHHKKPDPDLLLGNPTPEEIVAGIWGHIDRAFSQPVDGDNESTAEYVPTQVIAETFRQHGLDGLVYKSRLGAGYNLALFDLDAANVTRRMLARATGVQYAFEDLPP